MKVSVIMPAYNAARTIADALESVRQQTHDDVEIIVIDDGSDDGTAGIAAAHPAVYCITQANGGPAAARNAGLRLARGEVIAFLDADDLWPAASLAAALHCFAQHPDALIVQGRVRDLWPDDQAWRPGEPRLSFNLGSAFFRRSVLEQIGGFDQSLRQGEDTDLWVRLAERGVRSHVIDAVTLCYRRKPNPDPGAKQVYYSRLLCTLKRSLDSRHLLDENPDSPDRL